MKKSDDACKCLVPLELTGEKLYYCGNCREFFIEIDGIAEPYLIVKKEEPLIIVAYA